MPEFYWGIIIGNFSGAIIGLVVASLMRMSAQGGSGREDGKIKENKG